MSQFESVWQVPDAEVASGRIPGYVGAVRIGGQVVVRAGGTMATDADSPPMREHTLFRLASITKVFGGALTLGLVDDGALGLDDAISTWLPELAAPRVLVSAEGPLDQTVAAERPLTVRHLLTFTAGWGVVFTPSPLQQAMIERGVFPGPLTPGMSGDEFVARVAEVPLAFQPGEGWLYDTPMDLLGVLLERATGKSLTDLLAERITGPLGLTSTTFGRADVARLATAYQPGAEGLDVLDPPDGDFAGPSRFEELGSGLVSSAPEVLRFLCALADGGDRLLSTASLALMQTDALDDAQRAQAEPIVGPGASWGMGTSIDIEAAEPWMAVGRWGWNGGTGTTAFVDPARDTVAVLLTQRAMTGPEDRFGEFLTAVAKAAS